LDIGAAIRIRTSLSLLQERIASVLVRLIHAVGSHGTMRAMTGGGPECQNDRQLQRADPSPDALRWLMASVDASSIVRVRAMPGSSTAAMHHVTMTGRSGATLEVVLRRYVLSRIVAENPGVAGQEWTALTLVAPTLVPTPAPLSVDLTGDETGSPALVMSHLAGRPQWEGGQRWLDQLVDALIEIHQTPVPTDESLPDLARYEQTEYEPPRWSSNPAVWERAFEIFHGPIPMDEITFVHRDFHGGNTLWTRGRLTGVVDWPAACRGPSSIDIGHFRLNLLYSQPELAERLRSTWEARTGKPYDPWADVVSIVGTLDRFRRSKTASKSMHALETTVARAVTELGR
jgi:aminoglycoside phosphotransferase (APT) family kinase protein